MEGQSHMEGSFRASEEELAMEFELEPILKANTLVIANVAFFIAEVSRARIYRGAIHGSIRIDKPFSGDMIEIGQK